MVVGEDRIAFPHIVLAFPAVEATVVVLGQLLHPVGDREDLVDVLKALAEAEGFLAEVVLGMPRFAHRWGRSARW